MYEKTFNVPQFNTVIDNAVKEFEAEQKKLTDKINTLSWAKKCVATIQNKLSEAYTTINSQEHELEVLEQKLREEQQQRKEYERLGTRLTDITKENANLNVQLTALQELHETTSRQLAEEKRQREDLEMKLNEMSKLSAGMAKKASEEAMQKALRTYANTSKQKRMDKRAFAKTAILELANVNGLTLPPDLAATIDHLDDEQPETKVVVNGDFVQNKHVDNEVGNVASGAAGISVNKG